MSRCAGNCGRQVDGLFCGPGCRDKVDRGHARARDRARLAERPDPALDELDVPTGNCRRVLAVLRGGPASSSDLSQPQVGGNRANGRVHELRRLGFGIEKSPIRKGSYLYTLRHDPTQAPPASSAAPLVVAAAEAPNLFTLPAPQPAGPYDDQANDEAA